MTPEELTSELAAGAAAAGLVLDFDGTLAPIVDDPTTSCLPDGLAGVIERIADGLALVAIVSGRPVAFLNERAAIPGVRLLGLYGTEEWSDEGPVAWPEAEAWQPALDEARDRLALALAGHPGVVLEDKGLAVALHWRTAEDRDAAGAFVGEVVTEVATDTGLHREPGKFVEELRPPLHWDKGSTVRALVEEHALSLVVYVGDDKGDLPALAAARDAGGRAVVVEHGSETPTEVRAAGDVVLAGAEGVQQWLAEVARAL